MKPLKIIFMGTLLAACFLLSGTPVLADFRDLLKGVDKALQSGGGGLSEDKIVQGLKEALEIGSNNAVNLVSKVDGYYRNPTIRIPLPGPVKKVENILRGVGYGSQVDAFEESMNRAAEKAAPEAKNLFWDTIRGMNFEDARKILKGRDNEATLYFKEKTWDRLAQAFKPLVHGAMSGVGVTRQYQDLETKVKGLPFGSGFGLDLDQYVTEGALDGLFFMLQEEERKIRQNPAARVTDLLKEVFGNP